MIVLVVLLAWVMSLGQGRGQAQDKQECGGMLTAARGVLHTPNFPRKFQTPLRCHWVIDASQASDTQASASIVVYFTQLFVTTGLSFTEFDYYEHDSTFQLGGKEIHRVTEQNVTRVEWLLTRRNYLVVDFTLDRLEGNHLRVLDDLLDVYGFNITYEVTQEPRHACSVVGCSMSGHCYASQDFKEYWCSCFRGFSGPECGKGPLCQPTSNVCENGATCRQVGAIASTCVCLEGYTGARCELRMSDQDCSENESCTTQCPEDGTAEPCACGHRGLPLNNDKARYEGTLRLANVTAARYCVESVMCQLKPTLTKQISKYLKSSNLSIMEDIRVIDVGLSGEVRFHFWGSKSEGSKVRDSFNRLVQRGRLGNVTLVATHLAITQEPSLHLQSVQINHSKATIRQGEEFILTCVAQGSSHLVFHWFKDGIYINSTKSMRNMWVRVLPLDSAEQHTALLGVAEADPLDTGRYTCQVIDWGYQQCRSLNLEVLQEPNVRVDPMSITVEKGKNVTVRCTAPNELQFESKLGYSWTKNNALFKMTPNEEFWEDLYPGGSYLRIYNVQKSATYSCHVHGSVRSVPRSMRLEVLNQTVAPWCPEDETGVGGIRWEQAGPGVVARVDCPVHYQGIATRLCLLVENRQVRWQTPDFSDCVSDKIISVSNNFHKITLGYGNTTALDAVFGVLTSLRDRGVVYPGEGEPAIGLLHRVKSYLNKTGSWSELANATNYFYSAVNTLLQHRNSVIHHQKVEELVGVVSAWTGMWGAQAGTGSGHLAFDSLVVDLFRFEEPSFRHDFTIRIPRPTYSYPPWFSSRVVFDIGSNRVYTNMTTSLGVVVYNRLSDFLPQRYSQTLESGVEVQYEVVSELVTVVSRGPLVVSVSLELAVVSRPGWDLYCGTSAAPSILWNLTTCQVTPLGANRTLCLCDGPSTFAALLVKVIHHKDHSQRKTTPRVVLLGCACCLVQSLLTLALLVVRWRRHRTCLMFLKLQCSASILASMVVFLYACSRSLPQDLYPPVSTSLQAIILISLSSHLSKVLLVYTEVIYLPNVKNLKQTIIFIMSGVPLLVVLCNHISQISMNRRENSWWLVRGTVIFYSCVFTVLLLIVLFIFILFHVNRRLRSLLSLKSEDTRKAVQRRLGLLRRAGVMFSATAAMAASSVVYVNYPSLKTQYLFCLSCALLGFLLLVCYVLHGESHLHVHVKLQHAENPVFSSDSDSSPLSIFTKQEAEVECEGAPPSTDKNNSNKKGDFFKTSPTGSYRRFEDKEEFNTFKGSTTKIELPTVSEKVFRSENGVDIFSTGPVDQEITAKITSQLGSPRRTLSEKPCPAEPGTTRVCVITSVVVDTASVVVCSVDVEPCSVMNKSIVSSGEAPSTTGSPPQLKEKDTIEDEIIDPVRKSEEFNDLEVDTDVMDRICHDLDYLLGGNQSPPGDPTVPKILIQNTSL
ncbi:uncharacterized protein LOC128992560 [Macrosteles quadrilineatus]|uniref:uncharacterized protein LOC128992560 n=1 Tax=Macrosteles quadrilineatus TaxID=74068 RepID=UPI0023E2A9A9|nr:uncharacterized protein LOC128992560 [Macrosteles quadrilineatus]